MFPLLLAIVLSCWTAVSAKVDNDVQNWSLITVNKEIDKKWGLYFELQNRVGHDFNQEGLLFIRPAIKYKLNDELNLLQGYAWVPNFASDSLVNENRIWQQIDFTKNTSIFKVLLGCDLKKGL